MVQWPTLANSRQLRGFLGFTGYYKYFIKNYATIEQPLINLLKRHAFYWTGNSQKAFDQLKSAMTCAPILKLLYLSKAFSIQTKASGKGMRAVLRQGRHPIGFYSKKLCTKLKNSSTSVRNYMPLFQQLTNGVGVYQAASLLLRLIKKVLKSL